MAGKKKEFITYPIGIKHISEEINILGYTDFEMFLFAWQPIFQGMVQDGIDLATEKGGTNLAAESEKISELAFRYKVQNRYVKSALTRGFGLYDNAKENRNNHISLLEKKSDNLKTAIKSLEDKVEKNKKRVKKLLASHTKLAKKNKIVPWEETKEIAELRKDTKKSKFKIHHKKRAYYSRVMKIKHLSDYSIKPLIVNTVDSDFFYAIGESDLTDGNFAISKIGTKLVIRNMPKCMEERFGKELSVEAGEFKRSFNRMQDVTKFTWHLYRNKDGRFVAGCQFEPCHVWSSISTSKRMAGIDLNPGSIDFAMVDENGNFIQGSQVSFSLQQGLPSGKMESRLRDVSKEIADELIRLQSGLAHEDLDMNGLKAKAEFYGKKRNKMLSGWAYQKFVEILSQTLANRGIPMKKVNPAWTSEEGCINYMRRYGISSGVAAGISIARRALNLNALPPKKINSTLHEKEIEKVAADKEKEMSKPVEKQSDARLSRGRSKRFSTFPRWRKVKAARLKAGFSRRHLLYSKAEKEIWENL